MEVGKQLILYGSIVLVLSLFLRRPFITLLAAIVIIIGIIKRINNHKGDDS